MQKLIAGNWKMNYGGADAVPLATALKSKIVDPKCGVCVCPPFTAIAAVARVLLGTGIAVGGQNVAWEDKGAFTGEISAPMLHEWGATYAIVGHSERRTYFCEDAVTTGKRALNALKHGIMPILCVGETLEERRAGAIENALKAQLEGAFAHIDAGGEQSLVVAYEPIWAIGTGVPATVENALSAVGFIRAWLISKYGVAPKVLYGGSMTALNAHEFLSKGIDGGLIGGASLKPEEFADIVRIAEKIMRNA
ncbi:MAG: triose-phosphate isomerase [Firmicutes bacterium]|nr:triose-phosphate isomerase [Bacillota bacterium]